MSQTQIGAGTRYQQSSRVLPGDATVAACPLGGIGTGNVSIGARGELRDWEMFNSPGRGNWLPYSFFALRVATPGGPARMRVLESRLRPPYERPLGSAFDVPGLPRFQDSRLRGEYPFAWLELVDDELPVSVSLEAFTPLVPLDATASGLPVAVLEVCGAQRRGPSARGVRRRLDHQPSGIRRLLRRSVAAAPRRAPQRLP